MSKLACAAGAMIVAVLPVALMAQEAPADPMATARQPAAAQIAQAPEAAAAEPCKPKKKKKGFGLGGVLKAASKTGLTSMVGGGMLGPGGMIASAAINTGASLVGNNPGKAKPETGC